MVSDTSKTFLGRLVNKCKVQHSPLCPPQSSYRIDFTNTVKNRARMRSKKHVLTEHVEGESEARQAETLKEAQGAEHGDVYREGHTHTEHQHEKHREDQHWVSTKP